MEVSYTFLNNEYIPQIHACWMESFKDYHVDMSYMTLERMIRRTRMDRVNFELSAGAFYHDRMVGFILIGFDKLNGELAAFDAGTGVIKEFRGKGIAGEMVNFTRAKLNFVGIKQFLLEVIQDNKPAIKAYEKAGFKIMRDFNCYKIETSKFKRRAINSEITIKAIGKKELPRYLYFLDWEISWEYNYSAIENIQEELVINGAFVANKCIGFIVFYPTLNWIFMLGIDKDNSKQGVADILLSDLFRSFDSEKSEVKFNNIPPENGMNKILTDNGFDIYIKQYEMSFVI